MKGTVLEDGKEVDITIEDIASTGLGVGYFLEDGFRKPVFVPLSVPGDRLKVKLTKKYKKYHEGEIKKILKRSPERINPVCIHFGVCGACDFLHISYDKQIGFKRKLLKFYLERQSIPCEKIEVIRARKELHYRDRTRVAFNKHYGFYGKKSNNVVKIEHCYIINEHLNEIFQYKTGSKGDSFAYDQKTGAVLKGKSRCHYSFNDLELAFSADSFVQSNLSMNKRLIKQVLSSAKGKNILDLYTGNGNFALPLSKSSEQVTAVEGDRTGYRLLLDNIKKNKVTNIKAVNADVKDFLKRHTGKKYDTVILDPPRAGAKDIIEMICNISDRIVYVSCNAIALSKELKEYLKQGYCITGLYLLDMFPQTRHFETVAVLEKKR